MSSTSPQSPPKRPRLSLQIKALANGGSGRTSRCVAAAVDVKSPTAFNTLSNVYATAVDRSTPVQENPPTAILGRRPVLRLQTKDATTTERSASTPYLGPYLDTPVTAQPISPAVVKQICFPSAAMTATPPLSAQPPEQNGAQVFTFDTTTPATALPPGVQPPVPAAQTSKRRTAMSAAGTKLPYTHPRSLRSILRNSPLPPLSTKSPDSPRRQSLRLQEKAARRVAYNSPLTQEITTWRYTKSHIDLLDEDATPISPCTSSSDDGDTSLDAAMADAASCDMTRDGGQTPGPFEEMRRRMANMHASTPITLSPTSGGIRKRGGKRREKKRRWVWTIGQDEDAEEQTGDATPATAILEPSTATRNTPASVPVLATPAPRPRTRGQQAQLAKAVAAAAQVPLLAVPTPPARAATSPTPAPAVQQPQQQQKQAPPSPPRQNLPQNARELTPIPSSLLPTRHSTPDSCSSSVRHLSPEPSLLAMSMSLPLNMHMSTGMSMGYHHHQHHHIPDNTVVEPPTPSVESTTSGCSRDDVFETMRSGYGGGGGGGDGAGGRRDGGDVEMSDASSFTSVEEDGCGCGEGEREREGGCAIDGVESGDFLRDGDVEMDESTPTMTARPVERAWAPWGDVS
ncbi:hypothetical protein NEMBOFW57_009918 [Staphylotrichum longicolle]|uniref:Glucan 1, 4-alpha-glucosidase n=1 Tax=Staphylotrichum longicolle TaxID=669026 RepID=A0AAD4EPW3_9PEZI|nr:hypothetical protein NEMBOFW57_009918 [Staphylotrichum longicolle]